MSMTRFNFLLGLILAGLAAVAQPVSAQSALNKLSTRIISIADGPAAKGGAKDMAPVIPINDSCPSRSLCWSVYADALYWTARGDTVPYGQVRDGAIIDAPGGGIVDPNNTSAPVGDVGRVDSYYSPGFRVGGTALLTGCTEVDVNFVWWQNRSTDTIGTPGATFVLPLVALPSSLNAAVAGITVANGRQDIHLLQGDAALKYVLCGEGPDTVRLVIGGRYAHLDQNFQGYFFGPESITVDSRINFDGFGPRVGIEGSYTIWGSVFAYGRSDLSLIYGHFGAEYVQTATLGFGAGNTRFGDDRVVPILDLEIGLGWRSCNKRWEAMVGYTASNWFNAMTTSGWIESVQQSAFVQNRHNLANTLSFDGLFARVAFKF